uniref:LysM domain-containing protein n=1 Tax=Syphacia muris TaxID=451379 RepID=A0A0N5ABI3_9BILA
MEYVVEDSDTVERIAAKFECTVGQLMKMNKMSSRMVFAGQTLIVPSPMSDDVFEESKGQNGLFPSPGTAVQPVAQQRSRTVTKTRIETDVDCLQRFLKVKVKNVTENDGTVTGTLLVTPNAIMFDPDVTHPLVKENGQDLYMMMAPMADITSVAVFKDIGALTGEKDQDTDIYDPEHVSKLSTGTEVGKMHFLCLIYSISLGPIKYLFLNIIFSFARANSIRDSAEKVTQSAVIGTKSMAHGVVTHTKLAAGQSINGTKLIADVFTCAVSPEDKPELFRPIQEIVDEARRKNDITAPLVTTELPYYMAVRLNRRKQKAKSSRSTSTTNSTSSEFDGELVGNKTRREFWFAIPRKRVDGIYHFLLQCNPEKYGQVDESIDDTYSSSVSGYRFYDNSFLVLDSKVDEKLAGQRVTFASVFHY